MSLARSSAGTRRHGATRRAAVLVAAATAVAGTLGSTMTSSAAERQHAGAAFARAAKTAAGVAKPDYDSRQGTSATQSQAFAKRAAASQAAPQVQALRDQLGDQAVVDLDGLTLTPRQVARLDGALTGASKATPAAIALAYVSAHPDVFRLSAGDLAAMKLTRNYVDVAGIHHLSWQQYAAGLPLFGNGLQANVAKDGRLISVLGAPVSGLSAPAAASRSLSSAQAIGAARTDLGEASTAAGADDTAKAVLFQTADGARRAWETVTMSAAHPAMHVIDAETGRVLYRRSLASDAQASGAAATAVAAAKAAARGKAYLYFPSAPRGGAQVQVDYTAQGWLPATANVLSGNNTHTYADTNDNNQASANEEIPPSSGHSWNYALKPFNLKNVSFCNNPYPCNWNPDVPFSWQANRNQNAAQVFYYVNNWHDHLAAAPIGFTEAAGNFQVKNSSGQGQGGDPVKAESDDGAAVDNGLPDGAHVDNANMDTPPDGQSPRMQMYLQHQPGTTYPDGDPFAPTNVGDEADTVYHEYTHGLSNRLVVDASGASTLGGVQAGAMGEAWSDWYAMDYLVAQGLQLDTRQPGDVVLFQYDGAGVALDRTEPIDCAVGVNSPHCPGTDTAGRGGYTYGDYGKVIGFPEVHSDGEIWAQTLWDLRGELGSYITESLVTRAMELSPSNPSFLDERNAILQADTAIDGGAYRARIWKVFAHRGMGFFAGAANGDDSSTFQDFSLPPKPGHAKASITGIVKDSVTGNGAGGVSVVLGGHASGFPGSYAATTNAAGRYRIDGVFTGTYPELTASGAGYNQVERTVTVTAAGAVSNFTLTRDWAAASGGATVTAYDGPDFSPQCGPIGAIDQSLSTGWGSTSDFVDGAPGPSTPKSVTIKLPTVVSATLIAVDPNATCGDDETASTGAYRLETSTNGTVWKPAASGTFGAGDAGRLNPIPLAAGTAAGIRYVRFTMVAPQVLALGQTCPGGASGCDFMDMSELVVNGAG